MKTLKELRNELLNLHKTLMEIERGNYEEKNGKIPNLKLLNLLFEDENFIWLRDISILVAEIDELFANKNGVDKELADALFTQVRTLFDDSENHQTFKNKYQINLDTETSVSDHHERIMGLINEKKA